MIQHFCQAKMLPSNDSFHKSLLFSKSFKVFHCSVINVLLLSSAVSLSDSLFIIAPLSSFVNNFFIFFRNLFEVFHPEAFFSYFCFDSAPAVSSATALLYYHVPHLLSTAFCIYLHFITIDVESPAMLPVHSVPQQDESPLLFPLHQGRLWVKYMSQTQVLLLQPLSVLPC